MIHRSGAPAGAGRPEHRHVGDAGAVTVEAALALMAMLVVLAAVLWAVGLLAAQLALGEAARAGARAAARGDGGVAVTVEVRRLVPQATVTVDDDGAHVTVEVRRGMRPPGLLASWGEVSLAASAVAAVEPTS